MSKRKLISLLGLMTIVCSLTAQTQDAVSGLWYTSTVAGHATIVAPPAGEAAYTGAVRIPSTIVGSEGTYTVDTIGQNAFKSSTITLVEIPATVNFIDVYAFSSCTTLATIRCHATTPPTLGTIKMVNMETGKSTTFYPFDATLFSTLSPQVPDKDAYTAATGWAKFTNGFNNIIYDITIAGIEVTAENKDNITGEGITGTVRYDNETNVLLLSDAAITAASKTHGVEFYEPDLTIRLEGKNTISPYNYSCIYVGAAGTITGPGSLENIGDIVTDANLTFKNTTVKADRLYVEDPGSTDATFAFDKAYVTLSGDRNYETIICSELNLTDCEFLYPASASFSATEKAVVDAESYGIIDDIVIGRTYGLVVGDVEVTDRNKDNITGAAITGTISYDSETSTLTLDNASIAATAEFGIKQLTELDSLHINVVGNDTVRGKDTPILLYTNTAMSISGDGHLYVELPESESLHDFSIAIQLESGAAMTIRNTSLEVISAKHGICNMGMTLAKLAIDHSTVSIKCPTGTTAIGGMESLDLSGCQILSPADAHYNNWDMYVLYNKDNTPCSEVFIGRTYGITVAGVSVHELNKDNVIGEGITGTVRYDIDTKTLTLDNAKIASAASACIDISRDINVLIELIGEDSLAQTGGTSALYIGQNDTITIAGDGSLAIESSQNGISLSSASQLTISECQVAVNGATKGITGIDGTKGETLILDKAIVRAKGTAQGSICNLQTLDFNGCSIVLPESAIWKLANHQIESKDGSVVKDEVVIARVYPVYVAGVQLNVINKDDIATAAGISTGTITFDDENNVLTLENVVLETAKNGIETIGSTGLTIELVGENSITSDKNGISAYTALTIDGNGSGKLEIAADNTALSSLSESLVISKAEVTASGAQYGIYGSYNSELEISKSTVRAKGTTQGSIARFKSITLTGCSIATEGATVALSAEDATDYSVMVEGAIATAEVVIEPKTTAIETIAAEQPLFYAHDGRIYGAEGMRIYTLLGLDVTHLNGQLNGVYIVKTADSAQKIVVR